MTSVRHMTSGTLQNKWKTINAKCSSFAGCYAQSKNASNTSGWNEEKFRERALELFREKEGSEFDLISCWEQLKECPKWMSPEDPKKAPLTKKRGGQGKQEAVAQPEQSAAKIGSKKAKLMNANLANSASLAVAHGAIAHEMSQKRELKIMSMDISGIDPLSQEYFTILKTQSLNKLRESRRKEQETRAGRAAAEAADAASSPSSSSSTSSSLSGSSSSVRERSVDGVFSSFASWLAHLHET